ncbi:S-adenosyl-L-methionine-dependent methyltransferase [Pisolithus marmoratus]|nr:S-adenosyl-L-methionine-dependent methyltransferase [Pisolithus marmoratus]
MLRLTQLSSWLRRPHCRVRSRSLASRAQQWTPNASSDDFGPLTDIEKIMVNSVKATGPLSFATYMQLCLSHPIHGYYMNPQHAVFGTRGDFTTSPEISQVFGELVAVWMLEQWMSLAPSQPFRIVELGPGRGTLMDDMLRVFRRFPASRTKLANMHLVETSPAMRALQESKLKHTVHDGSPGFVWHDALDDIPRSPDTYTMIVAHEFFDALPVHLIEKTCRGWHEVLIAPSKDQTDSSENVSRPQALSSRWTPVLSPTPTATSTLLGNVSPRFATLPSVKTARSIAELIAHDRAGGCALVIDYGAEHAAGNSLRDIFHRPGECDITANVDFALLKESLGHNVISLGTLRQGEFLKRLGVQLRATSLVRAAPTTERKKAIEDGVNRLVDPLGMGDQYAVLGITSEKKGDQGVWPFVDLGHGNNT